MAEPSSGDTRSRDDRGRRPRYAGLIQRHHRNSTCTDATVNVNGASETRLVVQRAATGSSVFTYLGPFAGRWDFIKAMPVTFNVHTSLTFNAPGLRSLCRQSLQQMALLGRQAAKRRPRLDFFVNALQTGVTRSQLAGTFLNSPEYLGRQDLIRSICNTWAGRPMLQGFLPGSARFRTARARYASRARSFLPRNTRARTRLHRNSSLASIQTPARVAIRLAAAELILFDQSFPLWASAALIDFAFAILSSRKVNRRIITSDYEKILHRGPSQRERSTPGRGQF